MSEAELVDALRATNELALALCVRTMALANKIASLNLWEKPDYSPEVANMRAQIERNKALLQPEPLQPLHDLP